MVPVENSVALVDGLAVAPETGDVADVVDWEPGVGSPGFVGLVVV